MDQITTRKINFKPKTNADIPNSNIQNINQNDNEPNQDNSIGINNLNKTENQTLNENKKKTFPIKTKMIFNAINNQRKPN